LSEPEDTGPALTPGGSDHETPPQVGAPTRVFSLEGRVAPGLYLVGWLGALTGLVITLVGIMGSTGPVFFGGLVILTLGLLSAGGAQAVERSNRAGLAYHGPSPWLVFAAVIPLTLVVQLLVVFVVRLFGTLPSLPILAAVLLALTGLIYAGVVRLLVVGTGALTWREMGLGLPGRQVVIDLLYGAVFAIPVLAVAGGLVQLLSQFLALPPSPLPEAVGTPDLVANLISAAIIAPIGEELFFRGYATTAWARTYGRDRAIVLGAVFFALAHVITIGDTDAGRAIQAAAFAFVIRVPVGLVLGWLFLDRRSLAASIGLHATYNAIPVAASFFVVSGGTLFGR
jgi:membrane protease YdiL (CAAX protease family)